MKAFLGLAQMGLVVWGIVEAFSGRWWMLLITFGAAFAVGVIGPMMLRNSGRTSMMAAEGTRKLQLAGRSLDEGDADAADKYLAAALRDFRRGRDFAFLATTLPLAAIVKTKTGRVDLAQAYLAEAHRNLDKFPARATNDAELIRSRVLGIQRQIRSGKFDPDALLHEHIEHMETFG